MNKRKRDIILIAVLLLVALVGYYLVNQGDDGSYVEVVCEGRVIGTYSLKQDGEYALNGGTNIIKIENGEAVMIDADCPDHICIKEGKIRKEGQCITCLPNKLTVTVHSADSDVDWYN